MQQDAPAPAESPAPAPAPAAPAPAAPPPTAGEIVEAAIAKTEAKAANAEARRLCFQWDGGAEVDAKTVIEKKTILLDVSNN